MPNLKEVRSRIASIKSTRQITSAMKMVSASKLRRAQNGIVNLRPYTQRLKKMIDVLSAQIRMDKQNIFFRPNESSRVLIIAIASNKGLCGTYNTMVVKRTLDHIRRLKSSNTPFELYLVGKKVEEYFQTRDFPIHKIRHDLLEPVTLEKATQFSAEILNLYRGGTFGRVDVVYNFFKNAIMQELVIEQVLPVPQPEGAQTESGFTGNGTYGHILEPSKEEVVDSIVPKFIKTNFFRILLDASASEHGARMTAMHSATDNASELLKNLTLTYNKVRQSMITREIMEIVAGAEVMQR